MDNEGQIVQAYTRYLADKYKGRITSSAPHHGEAYYDYVDRMKGIYQAPVQVAFLDAYQCYSRLLATTSLCVDEYGNLNPEGRILWMFPRDLNSDRISNPGDEATLLHLRDQEVEYIMGKFNSASYMLRNSAASMDRSEKVAVVSAYKKKHMIHLLLLRLSGISKEKIDHMIHNGSIFSSSYAVSHIGSAADVFHHFCEELPNGITYSMLSEYAAGLEMAFDPLNIYPDIGKNMRVSAKRSFDLEVIKI
ncbi:MAG: hypothetical protein NUV65_02755 [Candidatus Roizmanbacteria bacterium]|nr:hypothetical protein [Candidatus Roizmanbacteria bacterium]